MCLLAQREKVFVTSQDKLMKQLDVGDIFYFGGLSIQQPVALRYQLELLRIVSKQIDTIKYVYQQY